MLALAVLVLPNLLGIRLVSKAAEKKRANEIASPTHGEMCQQIDHERSVVVRDLREALSGSGLVNLRLAW